VATAYDNKNTGMTYILVLGQALLFGDKVESSLLCPNQIRSNGVIVDDIPVHLSHDYSSTYSITFPDDNITIPLKMNGCFSYIPTRTPTTDKIETCKRLILTNDAPWEPSSIPFNEYKEAAIEAINRGTRPERNIYSITIGNPNDNHDDMLLIDELTQLSIATVNVKGRQPRVNAKKLAKRWSFGETLAAKTLQVTTQKGVPNALFPVER